MTPPRPSPQAPRPRQSIAQDILDSLLKLLWQKFYADDPAGDSVAARAFAQDRARLLGWVILWPARFISSKGFTLPGDRYKQILTSIILEALRHGNTSKVSYRPAWLKMVMQSHFKTHWEEYYAEAKSARAQADHALHVLSKLPRLSDGSFGHSDPVAELAAAHALLARKKPASKPAIESPVNEQLTLV